MLQRLGMKRAVVRERFAKAAANGAAPRWPLKEQQLFALAGTGAAGKRGRNLYDNRLHGAGQLGSVGRPDGTSLAKNVGRLLNPSSKLNF